MNGANKGSLETVVNCLQREQQITIVGHSIPDGDCIGSCLGMAMAFEGMGKVVRVVLIDPIPATYNYLAGQHLLTTPEAIVDIGVLLYLDCADQERTGALPPAFVERAKIVVNIDHHVSNSYFGDYCWVQPTAAATCEICLQVLDAMGIKPSPAVASALYTGILMDSGSFLYTSTTPQTLRVAARLLEYGAAKDVIREALFETKSLSEMQVVRLTLQNLEFNRSKSLGWSTLTQSELTKAGANDLHFEGIINHIRNIEGVEIAVLFREMPDGIVKIGFRSRGHADVNQIAANFGGGGHRLAAGAALVGELGEIVTMVIERVEEYLS